ncbi:hypothetical protein ABKN59_011849 [Abortiporus biennis]
MEHLSSQSTAAVRPTMFTCPRSIPFAGCPKMMYSSTLHFTVSLAFLSAPFYAPARRTFARSRLPPDVFKLYKVQRIRNGPAQLYL